MMVGLQGFEPWTSPTRTARSTKLSHNPKYARVLRAEGYCDMFNAGGKLNRKNDHIPSP